VVGLEGFHALLGTGFDAALTYQKPS